jgi:hypothetical protein
LVNGQINDAASTGYDLQTTAARLLLLARLKEAGYKALERQSKIDMSKILLDRGLLAIVVRWACESDVHSLRGFQVRTLWLCKVTECSVHNLGLCGFPLTQ